MARKASVNLQAQNFFFLIMKKLTPDKGALSEGAEELFFKTQGFVCLS